MKTGQVYGALKDGKPVGFKVRFVYLPAHWQPFYEPYTTTHTIIRVTGVKDPTKEFVVKYLTAEGKPRGWTLIEDVP